MLTTPESVQLPGVWQPPASKPLDEAAWRAWIEKGERHDRRGKAARLMAIQCAAILALLGTAALGSMLTPVQLILRSIVAIGALAVMGRAIHRNRYEVAALFAALAILHNPVIPLLTFFGEWQRLLVAASTIPFFVSLVWKLRMPPS